jgi:hypothetical protein
MWVPTSTDWPFTMPGGVSAKSRFPLAVAEPGVHPQARLAMSTQLAPP